MKEISSFVREELNDNSRLILYKGMLEGIYGERLKLELVFNRYSLELDFEKDMVLIYDDVMEENVPIMMGIREFFNAIQILY